MSIALSVLLTPSRRLRALRCAYAGALASAGLGIVTGQLGCFAQAWWPAFACWLCAALALFPSASSIPRRLDISGLGALRLTVQLSYGSAAELARVADHDGAGREAGMDVAAGVETAGEGTLVLLPGSTLWPAALLLHLRDERGRVIVLALLPDSVARGEFRALAVAFAAIAKIKIF